MGLRRETSHESSPSRRPMSTEYETESTSTAPPDDTNKASRKLFVGNAIPESPRSPVNEPKPPTDTAQEAQPPAQEPLTASTTEQPAAARTAAKPAGKKVANKSHVANKPETTSKNPAPSANSKVEASTGKASEMASTTAPADQSATKRSAGLSTKVAPKGPTQVASSTTRATGLSKRSDDKLSSVNDRTGAPTATSRAKQPSAAATKRPAPIKPNQEHNNGFIKPKPKSPTKPVSLPSSLMAPTASSVSKGAAARASSSRQPAGGLQAPATTHRSSSRASMSTVDTTTTRTVRRKPSTVNQSRPQSRPSIGPPPKKTTPASATAKKEAPVDEGFLARMMRPTQASSSKTNEKTPATPPKIAGARGPTSVSDSGSRRGSNTKAKNKLSDPFVERTRTPDLAGSASEAAKDRVATNDPEPVRQSLESPVVVEKEDTVTVHQEETPTVLDTKPAASDIHEITDNFPNQSVLDDQHQTDDLSTGQDQDTAEVGSTARANEPSDMAEEAAVEEPVQESLSEQFLTQQLPESEIAPTISEETVPMPEKSLEAEITGDVQGSVDTGVSPLAETSIPDILSKEDPTNIETTEQGNSTLTAFEPSTSSVDDTKISSDSSKPEANQCESEKFADDQEKAL